MRTAEVGGVSVPVDHYIGGQWVSAPSTFATNSPLDWDAGPLADVARGDDATARAAVDAAVDGFATWGSFPVTQRAEVMHRLADLIEAHNEEIAIVESHDMVFLQESMRARLVSDDTTR